jgi:hypothetical protein
MASMAGSVCKRADSPGSGSAELVAAAANGEGIISGGRERATGEQKVLVGGGDGWSVCCSQSLTDVCLVGCCGRRR